MSNCGRSGLTKLLTLACVVWLERRGGAVYTEALIHDFDSSLRLDVVHIGPRRKPDTTGIEIKSGRADFLADHKMERYLGRVNTLWLATLPGVIKPGEVPAGMGLLELNLNWPYVGDGREPRTVENQPLWGDVFNCTLPGQRYSVPLDLELDLLRGLALSSFRTTGPPALREAALAEDLALLRSCHATA